MIRYCYLCCALSFLVVVSACKTDEKQLGSTSAEANEEIILVASDSLHVYADLIVKSKQGPTILLFHQAGANARGEYKTIIPVLKQQGFNVLATDQRVGGQLFGGYNRTVAKIERNGFGYCDAYPDLEAALDYLIAEGFTGPKIIWGSSYSAALVVQLGYKRQEDIAGILAFSPASGEPMEGCEPEQYFESIKLPFLLLRPATEMTFDHVISQYQLAKELGHQVYIAENGRHGSSMLVESRVEASVIDNWNVVNEFLGQFKN